MSNRAELWPTSSNRARDGPVPSLSAVRLHSHCTKELRCRGHPGLGTVRLCQSIVCDDYFVPALKVIIKKLQISEDVAGATFMAAGRSAPELFTSLIGAFIAHSNIRIGTINGSAVFNILFVIGMCAILAQEVMSLTWWPLCRDVSFYLMYLMTLISFLMDNAVQWFESLLLILGYVAYVMYTEYSAKIEKMLKELPLRRNTIHVQSAEQLVKVRTLTGICLLRMCFRWSRDDRAGFCSTSQDDPFVALSVMTILSRRSKSSSKSSRFQRTLPGRPSWRPADLLLNFLHP
ncbi:hypothetical protein WMY93_031834 [Mugilogobius chulae]|uniref:Sodium/calcium exchanger membrane region domain-containing protein n=1 Tax=Mugilogobius chulae TaxID=88201 RepID=A0AAW0ML86_9GOBI